MRPIGKTAAVGQQPCVAWGTACRSREPNRPQQQHAAHGTRGIHQQRRKPRLTQTADGGLYCCCSCCSLHALVFAADAVDENDGRRWSGGNVAVGTDGGDDYVCCCRSRQVLLLCAESGAADAHRAAAAAAAASASASCLCGD